MVGYVNRTPSRTDSGETNERPPNMNDLYPTPCDAYHAALAAADTTRAAAYAAAEATIAAAVKAADAAFDRAIAAAEASIGLPPRRCARHRRSVSAARA